jgi:hypothetical protein
MLMEIRFQCKNCGNEIIIRYLKPGEVALCRNCNTPNTVPIPKQGEKIQFMESSESVPDKLPSIELIRTIISEGRTSRIVFALFLILAGLLLGIYYRISDSNWYSYERSILSSYDPSSLKILMDSLRVGHYNEDLIKTNPYNKPPHILFEFAIVLASAGVILLIRVKRLGPKDKGVEDSEKKKAREILERFVWSEADPGCGRLKANVEQKKWIHHFNYETFVIQLSWKQAIFIRKDLKDFFMVEKQTAQKWEFKERRKKLGARLVDSNGRTWKVFFDESSSETFKSWAQNLLGQKNQQA